MRRIINAVAIALVLCAVTLLLVLPVKASAIMYDLNGDGKTDIKDTVIVARAFGTSPDHPRWNAQADLNKDNKVDLTDLFIISQHFGERVMVVPEYWMGTVLGLTGCFAAFGLLFATKRRRL